MSSKLRFVYGGGAIFCVILVWGLVTETGLVSTKLLVSPVTISERFVVLMREGYVGVSMWSHFLASLTRTFIGFAVAVLLGVPVGLLIGYSDRVSAVLTPFLGILRPIPAIAFIPLVILWFGIGEFSKIALIFLSSFLYITLSTAAGVRSVPVDLIRAAYTLGVSDRQLFFHVILPESLPFVFTGMKVGLAISWAVVVAAELVAAQKGLGYMIMDAATFFRIPEVYVGIFLIGVIGFSLERGLTHLERRLVHWSGK